MFRKNLFNVGTLEAPPKKLIPFLLNQKNIYTSAAITSARAEAETRGYNLNIIDSSGSADLQLEQVRGASRSGEKAVIVIMNNRDYAEPILNAAGDMKVIFLARAPADLKLLNENAIYVGPDDVLLGYLQGQWLAEYFKWKGQNNISYILLQTSPEVPIVRTQSSVRALMDYGIHTRQAAALTITSYSREEAKLKMASLLNSGVKFDAIISDNDLNALGAIDAMESYGIDPRTVATVTINNTPQTVEAIRDGKIVMSIFQNLRQQGAISADVAANIIEGKSFNEGIGYDPLPDNPYAIYVQPDIVTKTHVPPGLYYVNIENEIV